MHMQHCKSSEVAREKYRLLVKELDKNSMLRLKHRPYVTRFLLDMSVRIRQLHILTQVGLRTFFYRNVFVGQQKILVPSFQSEQSFRLSKWSPEEETCSLTQYDLRGCCRGPYRVLTQAGTCLNHLFTSQNTLKLAHSSKKLCL